MNKAETKKTPYQKRTERIQGRGEIKIGNPKVIMAGKEVDMREWIQANNVDTNIYETLEKYGMIKTKETGTEIYGEIQKMDLRDALNVANKTKEMWQNLPIDVRQEFNQDMNEFIKRGNEWAREKVEKGKKIAEASQPKHPTDKKIKEEGKDE